MNVYDAATAIGTGRFEPAELNSLTRSIFEALVEDPNAFGLGDRINEFYASIQHQRPIQALGQKCGMDSPDAIAVDLRGNVMTCQNTGAKGVHKIGHVAEFDRIARHRDAFCVPGGMHFMPRRSALQRVLHVP